MDDLSNIVGATQSVDTLVSKREWLVGVLGAMVCYASILWLL
ncbi:hypothetical protein [Limnobacter sp.]